MLLKRIRDFIYNLFEVFSTVLDGFTFILIVISVIVIILGKGFYYEKLKKSVSGYFDRLNYKSYKKRCLRIIAQLDRSKNIFSLKKEKMLFPDLYDGSDSITVDNFISTYWPKKEKNSPLHYAQIIAGGGSGKSFLLMYITNTLLRMKKTKQRYCPIFIELNKVNQLTNADEVRSFIFKYMNEHYFPFFVEFTEEDWITQLTKKSIAQKKRFVFLLDGFDEVSQYRDELRAAVLELKKLNVDIVISGRERVFDDSKEFCVFQMNRFSGQTLDTVLKTYKTPIPANEKLYQLIKLPLMLAIYQKITTGSANKQINKAIDTSVELIKEYFNGIESRFETDASARGYNKSIEIIYNIAYKMEKNGLTEITERDILYTVISCMKNDGGVKTLPEEYLKSILGLNIIRERSTAASDGHNKRYFFSHQIFRDYFSTKHIFECIKKGDYSVITERRLSSVCVLFLTELLNADYGKMSEMLINITASASSQRETGIKNILDIAGNSSGGLCGLNFKNVNLKGIVFNGLLLSRHNYGDSSVSGASFKGSEFDYSMFLPQGHYQWVKNLTSANGKVYSAGRDGQIKQWEPKHSYCESTVTTNYNIEWAACLNNGCYVFSTADRRVLLLSDVFSKDINECKLSEYTRFDTDIKLITGLESKNSVVAVLSSGEIRVLDFGNPESPSEKTVDYIIKDMTALCPFDNDEGILACTEEGKILYINVTTGSERTLSFEQSTIYSIAAFKNDGFLYSCDKGIVYRKMSGETRYFRIEKNAPIKIRVNPEQNSFVASYDDNSIYKWEISGEKSKASYLCGHDDRIEDICFVDSQSIASCGRDALIMITDFEKAVVKERYPGYKYWIKRLYADWSRDTVYVPSIDSTLHVFSLASYKHTDFYQQHGKAVFSLDVAPSGDGKGLLASASLDKRVCVWEKDENGALKPKEISDAGKDSYSDLIFWRHDRLISIDSSNNICLWNTADLQSPVCKYKYTPKINDKKGVAANGVAIIDSTHFATMHWDGTVFIWKADKDSFEEEVHFYFGVWVYDIKPFFGNGSEKLLICTRNGEMFILERKSNEIIYKIQIKGNPSLYQASIVNDETALIASGRGSVFVLNLNDYSYKEQKIHNGRIFYISCDRETGRLLTYSEDGKMKVSLYKSPDDIRLLGEISYKPGVLIKNCGFDKITSGTPVQREVLGYL